MKVILVDDEQSALTVLRHKLNECNTSIEIVGEFDVPEEAIRQIRLLKPDAVFLDIGMPRLNGFDVLKQLPDITAKIIFTTAHTEYGAQSYRVSAFDYLTKPIDQDELNLVVKKLDAAFRTIQPQNVLPAIQELLHVLKPGQDKRNILPITTLDAIHMLPLADIIRLEADGAYTTIYMINKQKFITSKTLRSYDYLCLDSAFFKVHRSHIINLNFVNKYIKGDGGSVILTDGAEVVVSRETKQDFLERIFGK